MRIYEESDLRHNLMRGARTAVIGYGNQGHAHALNLRDGGADVVVGARPGGRGWLAAEADGFDPVEIADAVAGSAFVSMLLPDEAQGAVFDEQVRPHLEPGAALVFAHGFTVTFGTIAPPEKSDVILVAPKGQGHFLRTEYKRDRGVLCLVAVERNATGEAREKLLSYAQMLGCLRVGAIETTFREEAVTDLFGEQAVLCGGVPGIVKAAFETLVEAGYDPHVAYLECLHELKIITDLMYREGIGAMRKKISRTAAWGSFSAESRMITPEIRSRMRAILDSIESGEFARGWTAEASSGQQHLTDHIRSETEHPIEKTGEAVRGRMPYLKEDLS